MRKQCATNKATCTDEKDGVMRWFHRVLRVVGLKGDSGQQGVTRSFGCDLAQAFFKRLRPLLLNGRIVDRIG